MLRAVKDYLRRRRLSVEGVTQELSVATFTAGARSGIWTICPERLSESSVVYSCGVGNNIVWDNLAWDASGKTD